MRARYVVAFGTGLALSGFGSSAACGTNANAAASLVACKLRALDSLPEDPMRATPYDAVQVIHMVKACVVNAANASDAGPG